MVTMVTNGVTNFGYHGYQQWLPTVVTKDGYHGYQRWLPELVTFVVTNGVTTQVGYRCLVFTVTLSLVIPETMRAFTTALSYSTGHFTL